MVIKPQEITDVSPEAIRHFNRLLQLFQEYTEYVGQAFEADPKGIDPQALFDHELRVRCSNQYLFCRRNHGDDFLALVYTGLMPMLDTIADGCHKNGRILGMAWGVDLVLLSLARTNECPELGAIYAKFNQCLDSAVERNAGISSV